MSASERQVSVLLADLYPLQISARDSITLVRMSEDDYRNSGFLDHRIRRSDTTQFQLTLAEFCRVAPSLLSPPCSRYIFHISHVGSTLLSKVIGQAPRVLSLREPLLLRWLAELDVQLPVPESRVSPAQFDNYFAATLAFLSRQFSGGNDVVIKATSYTNVLARRILTQDHAPRALFVYSGLPAFLATIFKAGWGQDDIYAQAPSRLQRLHRLLDCDSWRLFDMSRGEITAMSWVAEMLTLTAAAVDCSDRVVWVDFDDYLLHDAATLPVLLDHLRLPYTQDQILTLVTGEVVRQNSKRPDTQYDGATRAKDIADVLRMDAVEVERGQRWFAAAATRYPAIADLERFAQVPPS
ncbi:hypothetical protein [Rugamonas apoptosis]|uniref:Sulfotransferase family protein n=1 Tax=Rugamonas apoptosis TaxID=2758570 RepID=A0A7W2FA63_9BURK|nr:hypothetical protein [Rugamonas apoptosis]MBA5687982.1 hypothetical protein [Rugamonas apoptosis]